MLKNKNKGEGDLILNKKIKALSKQYSEKEVVAAYQFLKLLIKQGKGINDPLAYLLTLLKNKTYEDIEIQQERTEKKKKGIREQKRLRKKKEAEDALYQKASEIFESMDPEKKQIKINEIKKNLQCQEQLKDGFAILKLKSEIRKNLERINI